MFSLQSSTGITIRDLKIFIQNLPEKDTNGEDFEVWLDTGYGHSNICKKIVPFNVSKNGCDLFLSYKEN